MQTPPFFLAQFLSPQLRASCSFLSPLANHPSGRLSIYPSNDVRVAKSNRRQLTNNFISCHGGKRYVFSQLSGNGIHSQRIISYSQLHDQVCTYFLLDRWMPGLIIFSHNLFLSSHSEGGSKWIRP